MVGYFSPVAGNKRYRARAVDAFRRSYEGASTGRRTDGWTTAGTDANAEIRPGVKRLRERARDMVRNNAYAARIVNVLVSNTIGPGIVGNFKVFTDQNLSTEADGDGARRLFKQWAESTACDFSGQLNLAGLQAQAMLTIVQSGGVIVRRIRVKPGLGSPIPFKLQVLEPDFIDIDKDGNDIVQGIQFDSAGKLKGIWLFNQHPGAEGASKLTSTLVPAAELRYCFRPDRPGQVHGVTWLAPVLVMLKDLDDMMDATLYKQKISAAFTAFVHDMEAFNDNASGKSPALSEKFEPGAIEILPPGKTIEFANPPSATDFPEFVKTILKAISAGVGATYEAATGDLAGVSFSGGRMGWIEFQRLIEQWRWNMFIPQFCGGVEEWFRDALVILGTVSDKNGLEWAWTPPRREQIDPVSETNAAINAVRGGVKSLRQVHEELGEDHIDVLNQIEATNKVLDAKALILDSDPRRMMKAGIIQTGLNASAVGTLETNGDENATATDTQDTTAADGGRLFQDQQGVTWKRLEDGTLQRMD